MKPTHALEVERLSLQRGGRNVISSVSFDLDRGERIAIVGPNGAGKTTLMRALAGLEPGYSGSVRVDGAEMRGLSPRQVSKQVGLVPQRMPHLPPFTVEEFLNVSGSTRLAEAYGLVDGLEQRLLPQLSGGELQRVLIVGAIVQGASILLLDEPTASLDPVGRRLVEDLLGRCHAELGLSCVMVTHDISLAVRNSGRMIIMAGGAVTWSGPVQDPALPERLEEGYGCRFLRVEHELFMSPLVVPA